MQQPATPTAAAESNRAYYEGTAPGVHDYWRHMPAPRHRVETLLVALRRDRPRSIVDLGCGGGNLLDEVARALPAAELAGIDIAPRLIDHNRLSHPDRGWWVADLDRDGELPHELPRDFAAVVASEVIEHTDRPMTFLRHARSLAAPGGRLYLSTQSGPLRETERRVGHRRHFTADEMHRLLISSGWQPLRVWNTGFPFHDLSKWYANRDPEATMDRFGGGSYGWQQRLVCTGLSLLFRLNSRHRGAQLFAIAAAVD